MSTEHQFPICEQCGRRNSLWYVVFPANGEGFPYLQVCKVCIADIGAWAHTLKQMCDDEFPWTGGVEDGAHNLLWSEEKGQLFDPDNDTRTF